MTGLALAAQSVGEGECRRPRETNAKRQPWTHDLVPFLDRCRERLLDGDSIANAMDELSDGLWWIRRCESPSRWQALIPIALSHAIRDLVHQDPFTSRSFNKPRGYAGDAELLDMIYYDQGGTNVLSVSPLGLEIFWRNRDSSAPRSVRERRNHLADLIDRTALRIDRPAILSVAAGHFREGFLSNAVAADKVGRLVALDRDVRSLAKVRKDFAGRVETLDLSIRRLIVGRLAEQRFDLIYAAGLYDYLTDRFASRLTTVLFGLLRPAGQLVVPHFVPDILDAGYMETYMDWQLVYRSVDRLAATSAEVTEGLASREVYFLQGRDVAYLSLVAA